MVLVVMLRVSTKVCLRLQEAKRAGGTAASAEVTKKNAP